MVCGWLAYFALLPWLHLSFFSCHARGRKNGLASEIYVWPTSTFVHPIMLSVLTIVCHDRRCVQQTCVNPSKRPGETRPHVFLPTPFVPAEWQEPSGTPNGCWFLSPSKGQQQSCSFCHATKKDWSCFWMFLTQTLAPKAGAALVVCFNPANNLMCSIPNLQGLPNVLFAFDPANRCLNAWTQLPPSSGGPPRREVEELLQEIAELSEESEKIEAERVEWLSLFSFLFFP